MKKTIALIAHDGKKPEMVAFVKDHQELLERANIMGGDAQIAALAAERKVDGIIFFRDPLGKHAHEPDIQMLMRVCDLYNVPLATNPATGSLIIEGLLEDVES